MIAQQTIVLSRTYAYSVTSDSLHPCGLQPARLLCPRNFPWQEYWSGLPFSSSGELPDPGIEPASLVPPALQADSLPLHHLGSRNTLS